MPVVIPRYPVYVISKGRWTPETALTVRSMLEDKVPFHIVIEPQELEHYQRILPDEYIYVLPFSNLGLGGIPARNWVWEHSKSEGYERHWILDDNIRSVKRMHKGYRIRCNANAGFAALEDFTDRYENIGIMGMNYTMFAPSRTTIMPPFILNCHVYSCLLIKNDLPYRWRGRYNEDTDLCLQVLGGGLCTILSYVFLIEKMPSMKMKGGNTDELYKGDGRLKMARALERKWPHIVTTQRRFQRPQHVVADSWKKFDTELILKPGVDLQNLPVRDYGLDLRSVAEVKSPALVRFLRQERVASSPSEEG